MAKILTTKGSAAELEELIWKASKNLYLISFNYIISNDFVQRLKQASDRGVITYIVYGKSIREDSLDQLLQINNIKIYYYQNLHAKLFSDENKCIIGSMNFSEASEFNNTELGVLLTEKDDSVAFQDARLHAIEIVRSAKLEYDTSLVSKDSSLGYCIRTGKRIPLDHEKPLSYEAYQEWQVWGNPHYEEKYCHFSGEKSNGEITRATPIMSKHWKAYLEKVHLIKKHKLYNDYTSHQI